MIGIYKITNKINNKTYVGQSIDIEHRGKTHIGGAGKYSTLISQALSKYGIENFDFQVLEQCKKEQLDTREQYGINTLHTMRPNGYNCIDVNGVLSGEENPNAKYSTELIKDIRERIFLKNEPVKEVFEDFKGLIDRTYFYKIVHGDFRTEENSGAELIRSLQNVGSSNSRATINELDVLNIRNRVYMNKEPRNIVWQDYKDIISGEAFIKAVNGQTGTNVDTSMIHEIKVERAGKPKAKITKEEVANIRYRYEILKEPLTEIFRDFSNKVTKITIKRIVNYETGKDVKPVSTIPEA